jgi:hypothetical protein
MKVHELMEELEKCDKNLDVVFGSPSTGYWDIEIIKSPEPFQIEGIRTQNSSGWEKYPVILSIEDTAK